MLGVGEGGAEGLGRALGETVTVTVAEGEVVALP
jgi:ABC-type phosphate transport system permease subunit